MASSDYFYNVAAVLNNVLSPFSQTIHVRTALGTATTEIKTLNPRIYTVDNEIRIIGIKQGDVVQLYGLSGNRIYTIRANSENITLAIAQKGIYIVRISGNETNFATKIIH
jgi:hypothetical protein